MGVTYNTFLGGYTPMCDDCGVALCWDIGPDEYEAERGFWDTWRCRDCNPDYLGARKRWVAKRVGGLEGKSAQNRLT